MMRNNIVFMKALSLNKCVGNYVLCAYADTSVWFSQAPGGDNGTMGQRALYVPEYLCFIDMSRFTFQFQPALEFCMNGSCILLSSPGCLGCLSQGAYARVGSRGENDRSEDLMLRVKTA